MYDLHDLLAALRADGVQMWVQEGRLRVHAPSGLREALRTRLREKREALIAHLERDRTVGMSSLRPSTIPLSPAQEGLWFLHRQQRGSDAYNLPTVLRLHGHLSAEMLLDAFRHLEERHEILRTRYPALDGAGTQEILPTGGLDIAIVDMHDSCAGDEESLQRWVQNEADLRFNIEQRSPFRCRLLCLSADQHVLVVTMHHIVADATSIGVLFSDLTELYVALLEERSTNLPKLDVQYADFSIQQRRQLEAGELDAQLAYWKERLTGAPKVLDLPTDRPRPALSTLRGGLVGFRWSQELSHRVLEDAKTRGMTPFMWLMAAFQTLLARWSGQRDICVGTPILPHFGSDTDHLIGYFLNTVVMRASVQPKMLVDDLFEQVQRSAVDAYDNSAVPFDSVVTSLRASRCVGINPLFQVLFAFETGPDQLLEIPGLQVERMFTDLHSAKFDLSLFMSSDEDVLCGSFEFSTDLFNRATVERLAGHFGVLVDALLKNGNALLGALPLLRPEDRHQILDVWNDNGLTLPTERTLHGLFCASAAAHPEHTALVCGERRLSYGDIDSASSKLAANLVTMGVGPESLIGICMTRCPEMVIGILGVLKAGGAYVPLDPAYPQARMMFMLADSGAGVLLTQSNLVESLSPFDGQVLCLDQLVEHLYQEPVCCPPNRAKPDNIAYLIYTSGSTGQPKGVAISHSNVTAFVAWAIEAFGRNAMRATLASTSICFDLSIFELFVPLLSSGTVILVDSATTLLESEAPVTPTLLNSVPSAVKALLEAGCLPDATTFNLAGEPLPRSLVEAIHKASPGARVFNLYGPSEYTTYTTWGPVVSDPPGTVSIGRPVANARIYILDEQGEPVPIGTPGEIFIAGSGLARGYWRRATLTAERFVPDSFGPPGERMYATGDLGRFRADGAIDFLGRQDQQVKIRGIRIEPGEIEAKLLHLSSVVDVAVVPRLDRFGDWQLVAHVVMSEDAPQDVEALRLALVRDLPSYMIPAVFDPRLSLPLTPNGKVDRKALAIVPLGRTVARAQYVPPRDATESLLAEVWASALRLVRVGIDDNFFELGGHSLLASRIMARLREGALAHARLRDLFLAPTVRTLASRLASGRAESPEVLVAIDREGPTEVSFSQQRMWFIDQLEPNSSLYNVCIAWRLTGCLDIAALSLSLTEIQRRHEVLRTVFFASDDGPAMQVVTDPMTVPLPKIDLSSCSDPETHAASWLQQDAAQPFDLANGPVFRASLFMLDLEDHILQLGMPHIVADGWSLDVLLSELGVLYPAFLKGQASPLSPLTIQYRDYAYWERTRMRGAMLETHLKYCRELLADVPKQLYLPWDRPRPAATSYNGDVVEFILDVSLSEDLRQLARQFQVTLFMLLAAIFDVLIFRYSRQPDFCIGYSVGNRGRVETEGLIGPFVNTLVHRARMNGKLSFSAHLISVRNEMMDTDVHQEFPIEKLVEELNPERDLSHHPIFQVTYNYTTTHGSRSRRTRTLLGVGEQEVSLPGLELSLVEPGYQSAKFDMSFFVSDTGNLLEGDLEYSTDLFDRATVQRMATQIESLCRSVVANPALSVDSLSILNCDERLQLISDSSGPALPYDYETTVHRRIESQVARTPRTIALEAGGECLTYAELNSRSNHLAYHLRELGVGLETRVAICVGRRVELVICILAVLKSGGAYVPLDPSYPRQRLARMLSDSGAVVVLTGAGEAAHWSLLSSARVVMVDDDIDSVFAQVPNLPPLAGPQNLAYCLYTSGSTGLPKSVAIQHNSLLALLAWADEAYDMEETRRVVATTSVCFDLSVFELFLPLVRGGCVVLLDDICELPRVHMPSLINTVPNAMAALVGEIELPASVRTINLAGEVLDNGLVARLRKAAPTARIVNLYGPTEYTTYASFDEIKSGRKVTIGRAIGNTTIYILDEHHDPTPKGVLGDIYVAGSGLARGYLDSPSLTAMQFIPNPHGSPGSRMYATGDKGRYLEDGRIEFRGRSDRQVKLHGFRIELDEIEHALLGCTRVSEAAVVVVNHDDRDRKRLVAFVALETSASDTQTALQSELACILPRYMLPSALIQLPSLPRTPNGKVDRRSLEALGIKLVVTPLCDGTPPITSTEKVLAAIWQNVLGRELSTIQDSFFALGGDSMSAMRMVARVTAATGSPLPLRLVFQYTTIESLAAYLDSDLTSGLDSQDSSEPIPRLDRRWTRRSDDERNL